MKHLLAISLSITALVAASATFAKPALAPLPIIDMHMHAMHASDYGPPPSPICAPFVNWPIRDAAAPPDAYFGAYAGIDCPNKLMSAMTDDDLREQTLKIVRDRNILAVVSGDADMVETWRQEAPDHVLSGLMFGVEKPPSIDDLRKLYAEGRLKVIGEICNEYEGIPVNDPRMEPYYALGEELNIPVAIHMGPGPPGAAYLGSPQFRMRDSDPLDLEDVLLRHPKLRVQVMHAGWPMLDNMIALMYAHPQVYVDTGVIDYVLPKAEFDRYLKTLVDAGMGKRIMFGSDNMIWPGSIAVAIASIEKAGYLTPEQKRDILYNNAARFLGMPK